MLTCLAEFNSIEQALASQEEDDRHQMQLLGRGSRLKIPEVGLSLDSTSLASARNLGSTRALGGGLTKG